MLERPSHLKTRQITSPVSFSRDMVLLREAPGQDNEYNEWIPGAVTETEIEAVQAPSFVQSGGGSGGIYGFTSLEGIRQKGSLVFWISTEYDSDQPVPIPIQVGNEERGADKIRYNDKIYKIDEVQYWNGFCQCLGILEDPQG